MKIINPSIEIMDDINGEDILKRIEKVARTCYKSEDLITNESAYKLVERLIKYDHTAMLEHVSIAVRVICDRAIANEIVRHRMASYAQESTRYVNYGKEKFGKEITVIKPCFFTNYCEDDCKHNACINCSLERKELIRYSIWRNAMQEAEDAYFELLDAGCSPQEARTVLPNSLKTEIVMTLNLRSWINFFKLRTAKDAHPQMREVANMILDEFKKEIPLIFDKINPYKGE